MCEGENVFDINHPLHAIPFMKPSCLLLELYRHVGAGAPFMPEWKGPLGLHSGVKAEESHISLLSVLSLKALAP